MYMGKKTKPEGFFLFCFKLWSRMFSKIDGVYVMVAWNAPCSSELKNPRS